MILGAIIPTVEIAIEILPNIGFPSSVLALDWFGIHPNSRLAVVAAGTAIMFTIISNGTIRIDLTLGFRGKNTFVKTPVYFIVTIGVANLTLRAICVGFTLGGLRWYTSAFAPAIATVDFTVFTFGALTVRLTTWIGFVTVKNANIVLTSVVAIFTSNHFSSIRINVVAIRGHLTLDFPHFTAFVVPVGFARNKFYVFGIGGVTIVLIISGFADGSEGALFFG